MMKPTIVFLLILSLLVPLGMTSAQNPPLGSKDDNACNPGGAMEGKCSIEWHWVCGWYLARWQANGGWFTPNNPFNDACLSLLPSRPLPEAEAQSGVTTICRVLAGTTYCFSSNQIATIDFLSNGSIDGWYLFTNMAVPPSCPLTYNGLPLGGSGPTSFFATISLFTLAELFTTLGLGVNNCLYF
jgi:hypothetical protein